jgi:hypothetical protein
VLANNWLKRSDGLVISEFCADNKNSLLDGNRESSDWIELYNGSEMPISLCGWYLTDDANNL